MVDSRLKAGDQNPRDTLWLLMTWIAVVLLAYAALRVAVDLACRGVKKLLSRRR